jgi:hypothetical protein
MERCVLDRYGQIVAAAKKNVSPGISSMPFKNGSRSVHGRVGEWATTSAWLGEETI